mmetsp:Transcript_45448/g.147685  ORF Transcript_45448/g.147685 Transcript_45448/m.147685 type:complete len:253 (-) Transcript_45448:13-771(-)
MLLEDLDEAGVVEDTVVAQMLQLAVQARDGTLQRVAPMRHLLPVAQARRRARVASVGRRRGCLQVAREAAVREALPAAALRLRLSRRLEVSAAAVRLLGLQLGQVERELLAHRGECGAVKCLDLVRLGEHAASEVLRPHPSLHHHLHQRHHRARPAKQTLCRAGSWQRLLARGAGLLTREQRSTCQPLLLRRRRLLRLVILALASTLDDRLDEVVERLVLNVLAGPLGSLVRLEPLRKLHLSRRAARLTAGI